MTLFKYIFIILFISSISIILNIVLQYFQKYSLFDEAINWIQLYPKIFLLGSILIALFLFFLYVLLGNIYISSLIISVVVILFGFTNYTKLKSLGEPLYPADFMQATHLLEVVPMIKNYLPLWSLVGLIPLLIGLYFLYRSLPVLKIAILPRVLIGFLLNFRSIKIDFTP
jgi:hypothetical protein